MIEFKNVSKHFGPTQVLHNIDLNIAQGEVVVIMGPSGSGKSTLLRCINKLEEITSGDLIVDGLKVNDPKVDERLIRQEAGMVFQQFYLFPHLTALENVMFGPLRVRGANKEEAEKLARELLAKVGLAERAHHYPSELSGGQQQRVAIARALAVKPKMMLFDEPTSALDPELRHEVLKVMQDLAEEGMTMVIVTHEIGFAEKVASRLIFIDKGRIAEDGDPQVLIKNPPSQRLQEFLQHVFNKTHCLMRYAYQAYRISGNLLKLHELVGRIRRSRRIRQKARTLSATCLISLPPFHRKGGTPDSSHLKSPLPQHLYLSFCSVFSLEESCGGSCSSSSACWAHLPTRYPYPALQPQRQRTQRLNRPRNRISNKKSGLWRTGGCAG